MARSRRLSFTERRALETLPGRMAELEARIAAFAAALTDPDLYTRNPARFSATSESLAASRNELATAEERWLNLEMLREEIEGADPKP
jgi:ATP-binding cassette subfamily F protein uup